jgi:ketosteroid isomerase-like protein
MIKYVIEAFFNAIINKNIDGILNSYVKDEETYVILEGPRLATLGFSKIEKGWKDFCQSSIDLISIEWIEGPFEEKSSEMAWLAGVMILKVSVNNKVFEQTFRGSFVLINIDNQWLIRHEHVSGALQDPYGIGDWLKK